MFIGTYNTWKKKVCKNNDDKNDEKHKFSRSGLEKRCILILVQFLEIFLKFFEEEVSDYLS